MARRSTPLLSREPIRGAVVNLVIADVGTSGFDQCGTLREPGPGTQGERRADRIEHDTFELGI